MKKRMIVLTIAALFVLSTALVGCAGGGGNMGTLEFHANGEDFVREGFVSKDGWSINFDHVYIVLADITAYQTDPPYDPHHSGSNIKSKAKVSLDKTYTVDLAKGGTDADPILVDRKSAAAGHYNAISWKMVKATSGPAVGYSLVMIGTAEKDSQTVEFTINVDEECEYSCGEFVGDERKGMVQKGGTADVEMTFHFDHIFGDAETPLDDDLNVEALGFEPFAEGGEVDLNMAELHLGHVGEGHCHCD